MGLPRTIKNPGGLCHSVKLRILEGMESLGHYLLRDRIALLGQPSLAQTPALSQPAGAPLEVFEGQDVRTGISVVVFKPMPGTPPELHISATLPWTQAEGSAWVNEVPVGAVQASWLAGRVEPARLLHWTRQLLEAIHTCQAQKVPVGWIMPELVWARGSKVWLAGVGVPAPEQAWDYAGLLHTLRALAGDAYPALPWREPLEAFLTGGMEYAALLERLEAITPEPAPVPLDPSASEPPQETNPAQPGPAEPPVQEAAPPPPVSKSLKVQIGQEEPTPAEPIPAPKRIRIEESLNPPFEVIEPPGQPRGGRRAWWMLWILAGLVFILAGGYYLLRPQPTQPPAPSGYVVEFRLQPPGPKASIEVLEVPEGSKIPLNTVLAEVPGQVRFDVGGIYRIRVRVQGRAPVDSIISVPNPAGVNINLR